MSISIVDYGRGNLRSVQKAFEHEGFAARIITTAQEVAGAERLVLPGQGAFADCMNTLREKDLVSPIRDFLASGRPYMGICLGLQILFEWSEEHGPVEGLGVLKGAVRRFPKPLIENGEHLKVPHMGWNQVNFAEGDPYFAGLSEETHFYFVHSYFVDPADSAIVSGTTHYGIDFCSAIRTGPWFATQFHPEKSQRAGLAVIRNFCRRSEESAA